jgi:hypothetical protein
MSMPEREGINMEITDKPRRRKKIVAVRLALFCGFGIILLIKSDL